MSVGQEGDTRKFRHLRNSDYYVLKDAVAADKRSPQHYIRCGVCGDPIIGQVYDGKYCLRCKDEPL